MKPLAPLSLAIALSIGNIGCRSVFASPEKDLRQVTLIWDAPAGHIDYYTLYYRQPGGVTSSRKTAATQMTLALPPGSSWVAWCTASTGILESVPSNTVSFKVKGNPNGK